MSKVEIQDNLLPSLGSKTVTTRGVESATVQLFDFSRANSSYEARVQAVTKVASICYGNPKGLGSIKLFDRLQAEAAGLPSSSYEFVPVLLSKESYARLMVTLPKDVSSNCAKFGEWIKTPLSEYKYLITNLRALINDVGPDASLEYLNTDEGEIDVIRNNIKTFLFNADLSTRAQMERHRQIWQELSRRYVSGKRQDFSFYLSSKLAPVKGAEYVTYDKDYEIPVTKNYTSQDIIDICVKHYYLALEQGVRPEEARRILPQAMMTTFWGAFSPTGLENFFTLRLDSHAQEEIRHVAEAMKDLCDGN